MSLPELKENSTIRPVSTRKLYDLARTRAFTFNEWLRVLARRRTIISKFDVKAICFNVWVSRSEATEILSCGRETALFQTGRETALFQTGREMAHFQTGCSESRVGPKKLQCDLQTLSVQSVQLFNATLSTLTAARKPAERASARNFRWIRRDPGAKPQLLSRVL